jgi:hypothetical protein
VQRFDVGSNAGNEATTANGDKDSVQGGRVGRLMGVYGVHVSLCLVDKQGGRQLSPLQQQQQQ